MAQGCWFGQARPAESCRDRLSIDGSGGAATPENQPDRYSTITYSGTATVVSVVPFRVLADNGLTYSVSAGGAGMLLQAGDIVRLQAESECPWWCSSAFVLRRSTGELLAAGWSGRSPLLMAELSLSYQPAPCVGVRRQDQSAIELELIAGGVPIPAGGRMDVGNFSVSNGRSVVYYAVTVTDHPGSWMEGTVSPH